MPPDVSRESMDKLKIYQALLKKWQRQINLVSKNTLPDMWDRHFADSLQLADNIPQNSKIFDLGSGAGFPGLVLAMARPDLDVTLIESDQKKCTFLSTVSRETNTPVSVVNQRIESVETNIIPDIITARALAALDKLLDYCLPWVQENEDLVLLFLKGAQAEAEIEQARGRFAFDCAVIPSATQPGAAILSIKNLRCFPES